MRTFFGALLGAGMVLAACGGGAAPASSAVASQAAAQSAASASAPASAAASTGAAATAKPAASGGGASAASSPAVSAPSSTSAAASAKPAAAASSAAPGQTVNVTLALGYIPNVQFAPFYVAQAKGFYKDEGINVSFDNGISPDLIKAVGAGKFKFAIADADTVISARTENIPVTYVGGYFEQTPGAIISLPKAGITQPANLKGKKVGIPGRYGSSYIGLLGVLNKAGLTEKDINLQEIGFNQAPQLIAGKVDAVVGFANNDALQIQAKTGTKPNVLLIGDVIPFVGNGLVTNDTTLKNDPKLVQSIVRATLKGIQYTVQHPDEAFQITVKVVPEAGGPNAKLNQDVLAASIPLWSTKDTKANGLGWTDPAAWQSMEKTMASAGIIKTTPPVDQVMTNMFVDKSLT